MNGDLAQLEDILKRHNAGNFIKAVNGSVDKADGNILMTLRAFYREPELLTLLWPMPQPVAPP